jgi:large subunit ribosomal protein L9
MEVILLEKIHRLGKLGDKVRVKPGYGRNYLIPAGKAVPATPENVAKFEARRVELEQAETAALAQAQQRAAGMQDLVLTITRKSAGEGKLYGSVGTVDIVEAAAAAGVTIAKHEIRLPQGPIRTVGEFEIGVQLHADLEVHIQLRVVAEEEAAQPAG